MKQIEPVRLPPIEAALAFIRKHFPDGHAAYLGGSIAQGRATDKSDLDLLIYDDTQDGYYKLLCCEFGWQIEAFVITGASYREAFDAGIMVGNPTLQRICTQGLLLTESNPISEMLHQTAQADLQYGPMPIGEEELQYDRCEIIEYLIDLQNCEVIEEAYQLAAKLSILLPRFLLKVNGQWLGEAKWLARCFHDWNPELSGQFAKALQAYYKEGDTIPLASFAEQVLEPYGGLEIGELNFWGGCLS